MTSIILNLGGEGEIAGAINLNNLANTILTVQEILKAGKLIGQDMLQSWIVAADSVDEVVANSLPGFSQARM